MKLSFEYILIWMALGLAGHFVYLYKQMTDIAEAMVMAIFCLPVALLMGPLWLMMSVSSTASRLCPYCRWKMRVDASVCPHCTRALALPGK
jgi:hypothetical protein